MRLFSFHFVAALLFLIGYAGSANAIGDPPYRLNWVEEPAIQSGCWRWNWQQYHWDDYCPSYVRPKAYMYRSRIVRAKG